MVDPVAHQSQGMFPPHMAMQLAHPVAYGNAVMRDPPRQVENLSISVNIPQARPTSRRMLYASFILLLGVGVGIGVLVSSGGSDEDIKEYIYTGRDSTWYSKYLESDEKGMRTSYDFSYRNSYSYISADNVRQWNYKTESWDYTYGYQGTSTSSYAYTGKDSDWYSSSLVSDGGVLRTSYDTRYKNSYSYISSGNVRQWNYFTNKWSYTYGYVLPTDPKFVPASYVYTGRESSWYSSSLVSDGSGLRTSYDYSYRNSYSYISSGNVK